MTFKNNEDNVGLSKKSFKWLKDNKYPIGINVFIAFGCFLLFYYLIFSRFQDFDINNYFNLKTQFSIEYPKCQSAINDMKKRICDCELAVKCKREDLETNEVCRPFWPPDKSVKKTIPENDKYMKETLDNYNKSLKDLIQNENILIDNRMTWWLTINGALLALTGLFVEKGKLVGILPYSIGLLAILGNISFGFIIHCAIDAIHRLEFLRACLQSKFSEHVLPPVIGLGQSGIGKWEVYVCPWYLHPLILCIFWQITITAIVLSKKENKPSA